MARRCNSLFLKMCPTVSFCDTCLKWERHAVPLGQCLAKIFPMESIAKIQKMAWPAPCVMVNAGQAVGAI